MNLTEYTSICLALDNLCKDMADTLGGWGSADWAEALEEVAALEAALADEIKAGGDRLAEDCRALVAEYKQKGTRRAFDARVEGCKQYLTKYGQIGPIVDALEAGEGDLSESDRKALISALNRLSSTCGRLSGVCLREFRNPKGGKTVPELIESTPGALAIAQAVAGYLTKDYKPKAGLTTYERGVIGWAIGQALGWGGIAKVGRYWGVSGKDLSRDKGEADEIHTNAKLLALKELLRGCGVKYI